jgi:hypothetical protein
MLRSVIWSSAIAQLFDALQHGRRVYGAFNAQFAGGKAYLGGFNTGKRGHAALYGQRSGCAVHACDFKFRHSAILLTAG